jgi:hypothetical protein
MGENEMRGQRKNRERIIEMKKVENVRYINIVEK